MDQCGCVLVTILDYVQKSCFGNLFEFFRPILVPITYAFMVELHWSVGYVKRIEECKLAHYYHSIGAPKILERKVKDLRFCIHCCMGEIDMEM